MRSMIFFLNAKDMQQNYIYREIEAVYCDIIDE